MKSFKNCCKIFYIILFLAIICGFYAGVFLYLEQRTIIFPESFLVSAGIFQRQSRQNDEEIFNNNDFGNDRDTEMTPIVDSTSQDKDGSLLYTQNEHGESDITATKRISHANTESNVMKLLDFNHRKGCPLNYSFSGCEYSACEFTDDPAQAHLVLINGARIKLSPLPPRYPGQLWLMYTKEPPIFKRFNYLARKDLYNQINWTRCIYRDSTFRGHYGALERRPAPIRDYDKIYAQKKYQVAWFVSNCESQSQREEYVKRMSSKVSVDIFGECGKKSCGRHGLRLGLLGTRDDCLNMVSSDYKFYLSFENSLCSDYVTEKFYKVFEDVHVIPVVRGGGKYEELAPAGSYINAKDFQSPEDLGKYLHQLSKDKQKYISMLQLKDQYTNTFPKPQYSCELCKALHTRRDVPSVYGNILDWMKGHCWEADDL